MSADRRVFYMNPLSPPISKRLGADDHYVEKFNAREAEWERKWNLAFSQKTPNIAATDSFAKTETVYIPWDNHSKRRDSLRIANQLAPQNAKKTIETELSKSENVRHATRRFEEVGRARENHPGEQPVAQTPKGELRSSSAVAKKETKAPTRLESLPKPKTIAELEQEMQEYMKRIRELHEEITAMEQTGEANRQRPEKAPNPDPEENPEKDVRPEAAKPADNEAKKKAEEEARIEEIVDRKVAAKVKEIEEAAEKRIEAIKAEADRMVNEQKATVKAEGKREGKEELWTKLKEKSSIFKKIKTMFKRHPKEPKTEQEKVDKYKRDIYGTIVLAGVGGAIAALTGVGIAQHFGYFLPVPVRDLFANAKNIIYSTGK